MTIKITDIWDVTLCSGTEIYKPSISKELTISNFKVENAFQNVLFFATQSLHNMIASATGRCFKSDQHIMLYMLLSDSIYIHTHIHRNTHTHTHTHTHTSI